MWRTFGRSSSLFETWFMFKFLFPQNLLATTTATTTSASHRGRSRHSRHPGHAWIGRLAGHSGIGRLPRHSRITGRTRVPTRHPWIWLLPIWRLHSRIESWRDSNPLPAVVHHAPTPSISDGTVLHRRPDRACHSAGIELRLELKAWHLEPVARHRVFPIRFRFRVIAVLCFAKFRFSEFGFMQVSHIFCEHRRLLVKDSLSNRLKWPAIIAVLSVISGGPAVAAHSTARVTRSLRRHRKGWWRHG